MRTNLNEEIQRNLRLMGILNEAASPSKGIFSILFKNLKDAALTNAINKINANITGAKITGTGITAVEDAIKNGQITRKQATEIIVDSILATGKSMDDVVAIIAANADPFIKSLESAAKTGVDSSAIKANVPGLSELSDDLVNALLSKAGFKKIGSTKADILKVLGEIKLEFPTLFAANSFWGKMVGKGDYKYSKELAALQTKILDKFKGKNQQAVMSEIKKMTEEAEAAIDKIKNMKPAEKKAWKEAIRKNAGDAAVWVRDKMFLKYTPNSEEVAPLGTVLKLIAWVGGAYVLSNFSKGATETGTASGGLGYTASKEFQGLKQGFNQGNVKAVEYAFNTADFYKWLDANEGTLNWSDTTKWDIYKDNDGNLAVTGLQDKITKKYRYLLDKKTYEKI